MMSVRGTNPIFLIKNLKINTFRILATTNPQLFGSEQTHERIKKIVTAI